MPELSRFLGIVITMYFREHPPAHFHARYGEYRITVGVEDGSVVGEFPPRALAHVLEWHELHQEELLNDWQRAREGKPLQPIAPLE